jgi:hypothetical protein
MRRLLGIVCALAGAVALVAPMGGVSASAATPGGVLRPVDPHQVLPTKNADVSSLNWSGYAVVTSGITAVSTHYIVPTVKNVPAGFSSTWAGIGGYNTQDLIQAGTESDTASTPYAWYEMLPASETPITSGCVGDNACTVRPGDDMTVTITSQGGSNWKIDMVNATHWTWTKTVSYASTFSSAEWILEAPTVGAQTVIANVGVQQFKPTNTYTKGGITHIIRDGSPVRIILSPGLVNEATPSALNLAGNAFNSCTYKNTCAAP